MIVTRKRPSSDNPQVFAEQVACALAQSEEYSLHLCGHYADPLPVQGNTLLRCTISFERMFTDIDGQKQPGYEYHAQYTEEGSVPDTAAKEFLRNTCAALAERLNCLEPEVYGLRAPISAHVLGRGICVLGA